MSIKKADVRSAAFLQLLGTVEWRSETHDASMNVADVDSAKCLHPSSTANARSGIFRNPSEVAERPSETHSKFIMAGEWTLDIWRVSI